MPNYVRVDSKPFDRDYYYGPEEYEDFGQSSQLNREKSMTIKLRVENTLRWRWVKDEAGNYTKQSNSRIIRWSDGSLSLRLGKELFDINQNVDTSASAPRAPTAQASGSQSQSQSQTDPPVTPDVKPDRSADAAVAPTTAPTGQGLTYLVAQHKRAQVLQAETLVTGYMTLRPTGMQSDVHRMLARAVGQKHNKVARLRMTADPTVDPEKTVQEMAKANAKKSKKRMEESGRKRRRHTRQRNADIWSDDDDDEAAVYGAASDEEYDAQRSYAGSQRRKGDEEHERAYQEDDFLVADDSSDDGRDGARKKRSEEDRMEDDPLDKLEEKLQAQEEAARRQREADEGDADQRMDVESEDDEDEQAVRKVAPGRRKRALDFDDDEEDE
jgi:RNA polymerase-associated protein LEO1